MARSSTARSNLATAAASRALRLLDWVAGRPSSTNATPLPSHLASRPEFGSSQAIRSPPQRVGQPSIETALAAKASRTWIDDARRMESPNPLRRAEYGLPRLWPSHPASGSDRSVHRSLSLAPSTQVLGRPGESAVCRTNTGLNLVKRRGLNSLEERSAQMNEALPCNQDHTLIMLGNLTEVRIAVVGTALGHAPYAPGVVSRHHDRGVLGN